MFMNIYIQIDTFKYPIHHINNVCSLPVMYYYTQFDWHVNDLYIPGYDNELPGGRPDCPLGQL